MEIAKYLLYAFTLLSLSAEAAREVAHVKIIKSGYFDEIDKEDPYNYAEGCKLFKPTKEKLINYFSKAEENGYGWMHEYYTPCIASGTVTFKDGSYGDWVMHDSGYGWVTFKDKKNDGKEVSFLHVNNGWGLE
ncbi:hypothetical protein [Erwinia sp. MYb416]|uniref:hypothetical protein n=1 Tax=Erwinia sp. MYb416 TaxID=3108532 RepID=UPI0030AD4E96